MTRPVFERVHCIGCGALFMRRPGRHRMRACATCWRWHLVITAVERAHRLLGHLS